MHPAQVNGAADSKIPYLTEAEERTVYVHQAPWNHAWYPSARTSLSTSTQPIIPDQQQALPGPDKVGHMVVTKNVTLLPASQGAGDNNMSAAYPFHSRPDN